MTTLQNLLRIIVPFNFVWTLFVNNRAVRVVEFFNFLLLKCAEVDLRLIFFVIRVHLQCGINVDRADRRRVNDLRGSDVLLIRLEQEIAAVL